MAPTNAYSEPDLDEGFFDSMFTSIAAPLAGSKRDAAVLSGDEASPQSQSPTQATGAGQREYLAEHVNPQVLCCSNCPEVRPSKRRASAHKVGEFHSLAAAELQPPIGTDQQFPDDCFEKFCQECNFDAACPPGCDLVCPGDDVSQGNGLSNGFMNFGLNSHPTSPMTMSGMSNGSIYNSHLDSSMMGFNNTWMLPDSSFGNNFSSAGASKLDFLASAIQQEIMNPLNSLTSTPSTDTNSITNTSRDNSTPSGDSTCICKWQHAPGLLCLAVFTTASALHKHIKTAHVDNCASCFCQWEGCDASAKDFKQRSKLSRHLLGHAGYRPYACSYAGCDKTFATNQAKDNHERTHTGERPYVCDRCGYTTTTHTQLQTHISALHEGKKPHKCRFCDFTCADSSNLSKHERTHQTLRPYRCPYANCTFKPDCRWENLKRHLRRSGHCPELLVETSEEYKTYRESVRREIDEWHRRNGDEGVGKMSRRKGRGSVGS
ncbi:zinc-finger protein [Epicoccum nigrum]|nr:zinc-finger protein [Epicoccum nigrum]